MVHARQMRAKHVVLIHGAFSRGAEFGTAKAAFEARGYTAHVPVLRHHDVPSDDGAREIATLSLRDYTDDIVALVDSLVHPPLLVGHSLGGLIAQLVAARTRTAGVVAACPAPVGGGLNAVTLRMALGGVHLRPWVKPVSPPPWRLFRTALCPNQTEELALDLYADLVCESGRVIFLEVGMPWLDRTKAARVDHTSVTVPVLAIAAEDDRVVSARSVRETAARFSHGTYAEIPDSDHLVFSGKALTTTMNRIDRWVDANVQL